MEGEFLEIHRSKLELDPCGDRGQPSIRSITHCVFLFCVRKDALNRLRTQGIGCFAERGMADIFRSLQILLPDMAGYGFCVLPVFAYSFPALNSFDRCSPCSYIPGILHGWWWHNSGPYLAGIGHSRNSHRTHTHTRAGSLSLSLAVYREAMGFFHYRRFVCKSMAFCTLHPL